MKNAESYFDVILNTVSAKHHYKKYLNLLDLDGKITDRGLAILKIRK